MIAEAIVRMAVARVGIRVVRSNAQDLGAVIERGVEVAQAPVEKSSLKIGLGVLSGEYQGCA